MPKRIGTYSEETLTKALSEIRMGKISKHTAAKLYGIPRSTILFRFGKYFSKARPGPETFLSSEEEIVQWLFSSCKKEFPRRKKDILHAVKTVLTDHPRQHPFGDKNMPGDGWYKAFLKRHPNITLRTPEVVIKASANVSSCDIKKWFSEIF